MGYCAKYKNNIQAGTPVKAKGHVGYIAILLPGTPYGRGYATTILRYALSVLKRRYTCHTLKKLSKVGRFVIGKMLSHLRDR